MWWALIKQFVPSCQQIVTKIIKQFYIIKFLKELQNRLKAIRVIFWNSKLKIIRSILNSK